MKISPGFSCYPNDILGDPDIMLWDMAQMGAYWKLVSYLWVCGGRWRFDLGVLRRLFIVRYRSTAQSLWDVIKVKFIVTDGVVSHEGLTEQLRKQQEWAAKYRPRESGKSCEGERSRGRTQDEQASI